MRILAPPGVFSPLSDTWLVADALRSETLPAGARVLDLCSGSGALAICAASRGARDVVAVEISRRAAATIRLNAWLNRVKVDVRRGDLFEAAGGEPFDLIVSNPPYVPAPEAELPTRGLRRAWDAGHDGRVVLDRICEQAPAHLRPGGVVLLTHSSVCGVDETLRALRAGGLEAEVMVRRRGPLGPLLRARVQMLERRGLLPPGQREEEVVVIRGVRTGGRYPRGRGAHVRRDHRSPAGVGSEAVDVLRGHGPAGG